MPQSKTEKQLKALEKLEAEYKEAKQVNAFDYRSTMLLTQIQNLKHKLNISLVSPFEEEK